MIGVAEVALVDVAAALELRVHPVNRVFVEAANRRDEALARNADRIGQLLERAGAAQIAAAACFVSRQSKRPDAAEPVLPEEAAVADEPGRAAALRVAQLCAHELVVRHGLVDEAPAVPVDCDQAWLGTVRHSVREDSRRAIVARELRDGTQKARASSSDDAGGLSSAPTFCASSTPPTEAPD